MTTLTELGEMLIEVDKGRELQHTNKSITSEALDLPHYSIIELLGYDLRLKPVPVKTYYRLYDVLQLRDKPIPAYAASSEPFEEFSIWAKENALSRITNVRNIIHVEDFVKED